MTNFDDMKFAVESLSGGKNTVVLDDLGMPSVMVILSKMGREALITGASAKTHPAFIVGGEEKSKVTISKYQNIVVNDRAYSLPMQDPRAQIVFDDARTYCRNKGENWGLPPFALWGAIALWCKKNGTLPHGNNNYGSDITYKHEFGIGAYFGTDDRINRTATGSGPATWCHDHTPAGIADLSGNVWEWCDGLRLVYGELQIIPNSDSILTATDIGANSSAWKAIDGTTGELISPDKDGTTANSLKLDYVNSKWQWITGDISNTVNSSRNCTFANVSAADDVCDEAKAILQSLALLPDDTSFGYGGEYFAANNAYAESFPLRGGYWGNGTHAGVFATGLDNPRTVSHPYRGFRSAYYGEL